MSTVTLDKFVAGLQKGGSVTQNWDVAVSYNAKKINQKLADNFAKQNASGMIQAFDISFEDRDRLGKYVQFYHLQLGPPLIQFISTTADPTCVLMMKVVSGETWTTDENGGNQSEKTRLGANKYTITLAGLMLAAAEGSTIIKDQVVAVPNPGTKKTEITVCLDFLTSSQYLTVDVEFPKDDYGAMSNSKLPTHIKNQLQESDAGLHYQLAVVSNEVPSNNVLDLVPSKFIFTTFSPEKDSPETSLTLLVQVYASDKSQGDTKNIQAAWINTWTRLNVAPIPSNHTAVIMINNSFFMQKYVKKGLESIHLSSLQELPSAGGGLAIRGQWPQPLHREQQTKKLMEPDLMSLPLRPTMYEATVPSKDYNPNEGGQNFTLTFGQANGTGNPGTVNTSWSWVFNDSWKGKQIWRVYQSEPGGGPGFWLPKVNYPQGTYKVDYSLNETFPSPTVDDEKFSLEVQVRGDAWKTVTTNTSPASGWDQFLSFFPFVSHNGGSIPSWVLDTVPKPTFTLDFHTLRFFLVTNILLPGEKLIKVDSKAGLLFPRDVVIVGDII